MERSEIEIYTAYFELSMILCDFYIDQGAIVYMSEWSLLPCNSACQRVSFNLILVTSEWSSLILVDLLIATMHWPIEFNSSTILVCLCNGW